MDRVQMVQELDGILAYGSPAVALDKLLLDAREARNALCHMVKQGYWIWADPSVLDGHLYCYASVLPYPELCDGTARGQMQYRLWQAFSVSPDYEAVAAANREYERIAKKLDIHMTRFWLLS